MFSESKLRKWHWLGLMLPGLMPLFVPFLPFQDWPGHLGVVGVMLHYQDAAANLTSFYSYQGEWKPNSLMYWLIYLLAQIMPALWASRIILALSIGGLGPAMAFLCRRVGADERLAYFALPLAMGRHVYCGFIPNALALETGILAFAVYFWCREQPTLKRYGLLLLLLLLTHSLHVFIFLAISGLLLACAAWDLVRSREGDKLALLVTVALSGFAMLPHLMSFGKRAGDGPGFMDALFQAIVSSNRAELPRVFWEWLFASYRYRNLDDVLQGAWLVLLILGVLFALRSRQDIGLRRDVRTIFGVALFLTASMFVLLPSYIGPPVKWWGGNLRLPVLLVLLLIPCVGRVWARRRNLMRAVVGLNVAICILAAADLWWFSQTEMKGFEEVIRKVPPGQKLTLLHWTPREVHDYPGEPHGYASNYYLLLQGGFIPQNVFEHPDVLVKRKLRGPAPPWAQAEYFDWNRHGSFYDAFVIRHHPKYEHSPLHGINQRRVELVARSGEWSYYRRRP